MVLVVAEIGGNANGSVETALRIIDAAKASGADVVKFQKRTVSLAIPPEQRDVLKETPWGLLRYEDYRLRMEFERGEFDLIDAHCKSLGIPWFASAWDIPAAEFLLTYDPPYLKVPSAKLTDSNLLRWVAANHGSARLVLSTGMSTWTEIRTAINTVRGENPIVMHCTSTYPCPPAELNLRVMSALRTEFSGLEIGYSGHEVGLATTIAAVALGAMMVERHFTLDRSWWGTDQAASVEPAGLRRLVKDIRNVELALGDGVKIVYPSEEPIRAKLRGATIDG